MLAPPPWGVGAPPRGNPGSATDLSVINFGGTLSADLFVILVCDGCTFTAVYNLNIYETAANFDWLASF